MNNNPLLHAAFDYARRGWSIIPIRRGTKQPAVRSWKPYQKRRPTEAELCRWFAREDVGGLAVVFGPVSGDLTARDFDQLNAYERWAAAHPDLAATLPTVETTRGRHVYFVCRFSGILKQGDGELRGAGGYCLLPPSCHPDGGIYKWVVPLPDGPLTPVDPFAVGLADATERQRAGESEKQRNRDTEASVVCASLDDAIRLSLPSRESQRNRQIFTFARMLRSLPEFARADRSVLEAAVRRWHEAALPFIATKDFEVTWLDFRYCWKRVRVPWGYPVVEAAFAEAKNSPMPAVALRYRLEPLRLLVCLCAALQRACRSEPFFLSCRTAGRLLGTDHATVARWLAVLVADGVLSIEKRGGTPDKLRYATRYRFHGGEQNPANGV